MKRKQIVFNKLTTPFEAKMDRQHPWGAYPRPQLVRTSYINLNGEWNLNYKDKEGTLRTEKITVPFPPESKLSGVSPDFKCISELEYIRDFYISKEFLVDRVIIHFGGVDQIAYIEINGIKVGEHHGGYLPFSFDITDKINLGKNNVKVRVIDNLDADYPYGKQSKKRGGMWYTPISGIWQTVWLESVPNEYIRCIKINTSNNMVTIKTEGGKPDKTLKLNEKVINFCGDVVEFSVDNPVYWTPEKPYLYYFTLECGDDKIQSYFALRDIGIKVIGERSYITLNGNPYFFHGLLDQGYFSDGIYLPATEEGYKYDILKAKELGFNMLRKHAKVEPDIFYYYCDLYGIIVFQDFVNCGKYNFLFDTALPTAFLKRGVLHYASAKRRQIFEESARNTVNYLYNHPCVCYYTIFNEGWGQYDSDRIYAEMKDLDSSRIWDSTSGWFKSFNSDVQSEHVYFKPVKLKAKKRPLVLSEFGGYSYKISANSYNMTKNYGYKTCTNSKDFELSLVKLYNEIIHAIENGLCASVLTQLSDVEDETNGLVTFDRQAVKVCKETMHQISKEIFMTFNKLFD